MNKAMTGAIVGAVILVGGGTWLITGRGDGASDSQSGVTGRDFHSLVADPFEQGRLYVGGHTSVARSNNGGKTWRAVPALTEADAMGWVIQPDAIWVSGHPGLKVSRDGGERFEPRNEGLTSTDVHAFGASGDTLYAAGPGIGVAMSSDAGESWSTMSTGLGEGFFGRMVVSASDSSYVLAGDYEQGVMASRDGGRTWEALGTNPVAWLSSVDDGETIYASGGPAPQRSRDGGATWETLNVPEGATLVEAAPDGVLFAGVHDGLGVTVWRSLDDGTTWSRP